MIIQHLSPSTLGRLHRQGWVRLQHKQTTYVLRFAKGKWFSVTQYLSDFNSKTKNHAKVTVRIDDIFSFFQTSFIKAYEDLIGQVPDIITKGKAGRATFKIEEFDQVLSYWSVEIQMLKDLAHKFRTLVYGAGFRIKDWHGPGALASYTMRTRGTKSHMAQTADEIRLAARYAYAGGRFELYKVGRIQGPIYGIDINSAYPNAIARLPSLTEGEWHHVNSDEILERLQNGRGHLPPFGIWKLRLSDSNKSGFALQPSPLFHRDLDHNITFPWQTMGWYYSHEAYLAYQHGAEILEGYVYSSNDSLPFEWIRDMYETRRDWKRRGLPSQLALKLCMNSIYGKLAQRVGWDEQRKRVPPWHQLEWAGWITSYTRAMLYAIIRKIPVEHLIAVETDGIYTTMLPETLGIHHSNDLGGWDVSEYEEMIYVQSGMAWLKNSHGWTPKRRGLDKNSFTLDDCQRYVEKLGPGKDWPGFVGNTTRFVGLGQALQSARGLPDTHCVWETRTREINPGSTGKRVHIHRLCRACQTGHTAAERPHDLVIRSMSTLDIRSYPHPIPWEENYTRAKWRDSQESVDDGVFLQLGQ